MLFIARSPYCGHWLTCSLWKGYSHRILFFLGHFTIDKNRFILPGIQVFWCQKLIQNRYTSQGIQLLNKTLDLPGHFKYLSVISFRIKKNAIILPKSKQNFRKTGKSLLEYLFFKGSLNLSFQFNSRIPQYPRKRALFLTEYQILPVCFQQNSSFWQLRLYFLSEILPIPRQKQTSKHLFYRTAPSGCFCSKRSKLTIKLSQGNQIKLFSCLFCKLWADSI